MSVLSGPGPGRRGGCGLPARGDVWGEREGQVAGPFGHRWGLFQHVRDVSLEEMSRAAAGVLSGSGTGPRAG
jgi:hypothetical protein